MKRTLIAFVTLLASSAAHAEVYTGASFLWSEFSKYQDVGRGSGNKLYLGYKFDSNPWYLEYTHFDGGHPKVDDYTDGGGNTVRNGKLGLSGGSYRLGVRGGTPQLQGWIKAGYYSGNTEASFTYNGTPVSSQGKSTGASWGLGCVWMFAKYVGLTFDLEGLSNVKALPGLKADEQSTVTMYSFGLEAHFPPFSASAPPPPKVERVPERIKLPPPAPVAPESAAPAIAPAATQPAAPAGGTRMLPAGSVVRERPADAATGKTLEKDTVVSLVSRWENPEGAWWVVEFNGQRGWVMEKNLPPP